jgi:hypothetical protein
VAYCASHPLHPIKKPLEFCKDKHMKEALFTIKGKVMEGETTEGAKDRKWWSYLVFDPETQNMIGYVKNKPFTGVKKLRTEWWIFDPADRAIGKIYNSTEKNIAQRFVPFGHHLVAQEICLEIDGKVIAKVNQKIRLGKDYWDIDCKDMPEDLDKRLLFTALLEAISMEETW